MKDVIGKKLALGDQVAWGPTQADAMFGATALRVGEIVEVTEDGHWIKVKATHGGAGGWKRPDDLLKVAV